jgi:hypothetical protein
MVEDAARSAPVPAAATTAFVSEIAVHGWSAAKGSAVAMLPVGMI